MGYGLVGWRGAPSSAASSGRNWGRVGLRWRALRGRQIGETPAKPISAYNPLCKLENINQTRELGMLGCHMNKLNLAISPETGSGG